MANLCLIFKTYQKSTVAYIKSFPIKRVVSISRAETTMLRTQTTTTCTVSRNSHSTRFIVPNASARRQELIVTSGQSQMHYSSNEKMTTAGL